MNWDRHNTSRRNLLLGGIGMFLPGAGWSWMAARQQRDSGPLTQGYGPLRPVVDETTGLPLLSLPPGFSYCSYGWTGDATKDGTPTPRAHDGMAVVSANRQTVTLIRNHEVVDGGLISEHAPAYDHLTGGGTTTLHFDVVNGRWEGSEVSLAGTLANCSGGATPWGTWLSGEEMVCSTDGFLGKYHMFRTIPVKQPHGFVFEVPANGRASAKRLEAMGCFRHEAIACDPRTGYFYETEDAWPAAGFYRFRPKAPQSLDDGQLDMMVIKGHSDVRSHLPGGWHDVSWAPIDDPTRGHKRAADYDSAGVYSQGRAGGATTFIRLEGCWSGHNRVYFTSTSGGRKKLGQLFEYDPGRERVRLLVEAQDAAVLNAPDNLTTTPDGGLVICEDNGSPIQRLIALSPAGQVFPLAANNVVLAAGSHRFEGDFRREEWAGVSFSPDGRYLFANIQIPGITFAITGPWDHSLT